MAGIQMKRNFHGLQVIDDELLMAFCIAYRSTQCSECNSYGDGYGDGDGDGYGYGYGTAQKTRRK
jgi:hypothetical protein